MTINRDPLTMASPSIDIPEEQYHSIRRRLVTFFRMNACPDPESLADEAIYRAVRRIKEGVPLDSPLAAYCLGIARNVLREFRKERRVEEISQEPTDHSTRGFANLNRIEEVVFLSDCLSPLTPHQRKLWLDYHLGDRQTLASGRGQSPNALRIEIHRITTNILQHLNVTREGRHERFR